MNHSIQNLKQAYHLIRRKQASSRAEIAKGLSLSRPTATLLVEQLLKFNLIRETGKGLSTGGKRPILLETVPDSFDLIGIDLGQHQKICGVRLDATGRIAATVEHKFPSPDLNTTMRSIQKITQKLKTKRTLGVGIALPGIIHPQTGTVQHSIVPEWEGSALQDALPQNSPMQWFFENRARANAYSEQFEGAAQNIRNFILISLGQSIGSVLCLNNQIQTGVHGKAGEIRTLKVTGYGKQTFQTLEQALHPPQKTRGELVIDRIAEGIEQIVAFIDTDTVILAGETDQPDTEMAEKLEERLSASASCRVFPATFGKFSAARGAALELYEKTEFMESIILSTTGRIKK